MVDASSYTEPSTSTAAKALDSLEGPRKVLLLLGGEEATCAKSFRNIPRVVVLAARDAGVADVIGARTLLLSEAAIDDLAVVAAEPQQRVAAQQEAA